MSTEDSGLKVLKASITNFKNITHKEVELNGRSVMFVGPNNVGKSSLIQAICSPINSKFMPSSEKIYLY
jgi:recombinational DNA repair ATPase RecF